MSQQRPTLQQLAAQSAGVDPWACPRCGCKDWRVVDSRLNGGERNRKRACRHCHTELPTKEVPVPEGFKVVVVPDEERAAA